jgi:ankyrin repeat protein
MKPDPCYIHYDGKTQLHFTCQASNIELVKELLLLGVDINKQDFDGRTALHLAKNPVIVKMLLEAGANPGLQNRPSGYTPLLDTFIWHNKPKFDLLVTVSDLNIKTFYGYTALMLASRLDDLNTIEILINAGADLYIRNNEGEDFYDLLITPSKEIIAAKYPEFLLLRELRIDPASIKALAKSIH